MSTLNQAREKFDKDAAKKDFGPTASELAKAFSQNIPDIAFLAVTKPARSTKRKKGMSVQRTKKQKIA